MNEHSPLRTLLRKKIRTCECSLIELIFKLQIVVFFCLILKRTLYVFNRESDPRRITTYIKQVVLTVVSGSHKYT